MRFSSNIICYKRPIIVLLICAHLVSCTQWLLIKKPAEQYITKEKPEWIEVELLNGDKLILNKPFIVNDQLFGTTIKNNLEGDETTRATICVAVNEIKKLKEKKSVDKDVIVTSIFGILVFVGIVAIVGLIYFLSNPPDTGLGSD